MRGTGETVHRASADIVQPRESETLLRRLRNRVEAFFCKQGGSGHFLMQQVGTSKQSDRSVDGPTQNPDLHAIILPNTNKAC